MYLQDIYLHKNLILNNVQLVVQTQLAVMTVDCTHTTGTDVLLQPHSFSCVLKCNISIHLEQINSVFVSIQSITCDLFIT